MITQEHYFDHDADIGIIGYGKTLEAAFMDGAKTCFAMMADLSKISVIECVEFEFVETDVELAFIIWLNRLLGEARAGGLIFSEFHLTRCNDCWQAKACGAPFTLKERGIEVKGATLAMLQVKQLNDEQKTWYVRCVVDV